MADVIATAQGAKAAAAGISVWVPVISAGAGIIGALGSQWLSHIFITGREKRASEEKLNLERYFIATELVFLLEKFAADCADVAVSGVDVEDRLIPGVSVPSPEISYAGIKGDWRSVPETLLYRLRELPVLRASAEALIRYVIEQTGYIRGTLECRQYQYARMGLFALFSAAKLRRKCGLPAPLREADSRTVFAVLWLWRRHLWSRKLNSDFTWR